MKASPLRSRWVQAWIAALLVAPGVLLAAGPSSADQELGNYNGTVSATALHVQAGSAAFPNFASGAIDNRYPLAAARLDSSPFANAVSSPLDTGPLGQTIAASGQQNQTQYADVRCPPQCDDKPTTVGSEPGPFASSQAGEKKAVATAKAGGAALGGGAPAPPAPPGKTGFGLPSSSSGDPTPSSSILEPARAAALRSALLAWRSHYLTADDARRYPMPAAGMPDGIAGDSARSESRLDGTALVLDGASAVGQVVLGGGALVLRDVSVKVTVTNDGTPKRDVLIDVGSAMVGGTPVTIGADGVSVNGQAVPGLAATAPQANAALNQALGQAGLQVRSLAPSQQVTDHQLTLDAVGVLIRFAPASPAPGVPANFTAMAVGEVFADSLAVPGAAGGGELDDGVPDVGGDTGSITPPAADTATGSGGEATAPDLSTAYGDAGSTGDASGTGSAGSGSFSSGTIPSSGSASSGTGSSGAQLGSNGPSRSTGGSAQLASPAASRRLVGHDKPTKLLLLYLIWQSLVIGTVASLYLWRKAIA
ncbi:MAG: hypothetical protein LC792_04175 [Actinobacteria bacterium]|nr:hypothetical protein [Actinomycetota bacterium]